MIFKRIHRDRHADERKLAAGDCSPPDQALPGDGKQAEAHARYQTLDWDSGFFGMKVARIVQPGLSTRELSDVLLELGRQRARLVYWPANREHEETIISRLHGSLVDIKTAFAVDLRSLDFRGMVSTDIVEPYADSMPVADLEDLAVQSGGQSRFALDPHFPKDRLVALYELWINRSIRREMATEVLVIRDGRKVVGMVTLGEKNGRGDIGLIAVDSNHRGRQYGERLVRAAQKWFGAQGYEYGQVVTQGRNVPACRLYEKCGYSVERTEYFYHFWLPHAAR